MPGSDTGGSDGTYTRRDAIKAAAVASGVSFVAGCSGSGGEGASTSTGDGSSDATDAEGDGGDGEDTETDSETVSFVDTPFREGKPQTAPFTKSVINPYADNAEEQFLNMFFARMGGFSLGTGEWVHADIEGWEVDGENNQLRIRIKDGVYWHKNGEILDPVTGEDWAIYEEIWHRLTPEEDRPDNPTVVGRHEAQDDEKVYVRELNPDGYNDKWVEPSFARLATYRKGWYADRLEELKDATTKSAKDEVRNKIISRSVTASDEVPLSGPYFKREVNPQRVTFERVPDHWSADELNWKNMELVKLSSSGNAGFQALKADRIDQEHSALPDQLESMPSGLQQVMSATGSPFGLNIAPNYGGPVPAPLGKGDSDTVGKQTALIRQALAHAMSFEDAILNNFGRRAGQALRPYQKAHPGGDAKFKNGLPDLWDQLPSFGEQEPDVAEQKLREAGLSKEGGTWMYPNGDPMELKTESWSWSSGALSTAVQDWKEIGIKAELITQETSKLVSRMNQGTHFIGSSYPNHLAPVDEATRDWTTRGQARVTMNFPKKYEIPPVGEYDADPTETINPMELTSDWGTTSLEDHIDEVRKLTWAFAYHLPTINVCPYPNSVTINKRHFDWPKPVPEGGFSSATGDHHPIWTVSHGYRLLRRGIPGLNAKQ